MAVEGVAESYMQSSSAGNPKAVFHQLLWDRFGSKMGSRYYRQAVRVLAM